MIALDQPGLTSGYIHFHNSTDKSASQFVRLPSSDRFLICDDDMVFGPARDLGGVVQKGDILGHGHFIDRVGTKPKPYLAPYDD